LTAILTATAAEKFVIPHRAAVLAVWADGNERQLASRAAAAFSAPPMRPAL
jgi:hypothetical protein